MFRSTAEEGGFKKERRRKYTRRKRLKKRWESRTEISHSIVFVFRLVRHPGSYQLKSSQATQAKSELRLAVHHSLLSAGGVQLRLPLSTSDACFAEDYLTPKIFPPENGDASHISPA
jgi:hypothetical protein